MNLDELQSVRDRERQTDKLQQLRETFYADAGEFIQELRDQRDRAAERADNPFDAPEVSRLSDEIDTAEGTVEAIYEKRVGKIVKAASFAAADLPAESDGMTAEEQELFETLVADIKANRERVLEVIDGEDSSGTEAGAGTETESNADAVDVSAADVMGERAGTGTSDTGGGGDVGERADTDQPGARNASPEPTREQSRAPTGKSGEPEGTRGATGTTEESPEPTGATATNARSEGGPGAGDGASRNEGGGLDRETVRITDDVGPIFGVDEREYDLGEDDVVRLPAANAEPLVERDVAERLD